MKLVIDISEESYRNLKEAITSLQQNGVDFSQMSSYVLAIVNGTPQEPKTGHWIENAPEYQIVDPPYICSECGNAHLRKTNYCDQCGAKMAETEEE